MEDVAFRADANLKIMPRYQETIPVTMTLPMEGMVMLEPARRLFPPTLGMPQDIGNMFSKIKKVQTGRITTSNSSKKQWERTGQYLLYNTGKDPMSIAKGDIIGHCSLIYQDSPDGFMTESGHVKREASANQRKWRRMRANMNLPCPDLSEPDKGYRLSKVWVKEAFHLSSIEVLKDKPKLTSLLVDTLALHARVFEGGPHHSEMAGQTG